MNRLDPRLQASAAQRLLTHEHLGNWSVDTFELAQMVARSPVTVTGGFSNVQITLNLAVEADDATVAAIPFRLGSEQITLSLHESALDALAGLLERGTEFANAGRTLSLDAIEAVLAGLLAPVDDLSVGAGSWNGPDASRHLCVLQFNDAVIPVQGSVRALRALHAAMTSKADRTIAAPLSYLRLPTRARMAVTVEEVLGLVSLTADDLANLESGGGVILDTVWPYARTIAGRRFVSAEQAWLLEEELNSAPVIVRSGHAIRALDDPALNSSVDRTDGLELVRGEEVIATGRLAAIERKGRLCTVFAIDQLF